MPSEEILKQRFYNEGLTDFIEKTNLIQELADQKISPELLLEKIHTSLADYSKVIEHVQHKNVITDAEAKIKFIVLDKVLAPNSIESDKFFKLLVSNMDQYIVANPGWITEMNK